MKFKHESQIYKKHWICPKCRYHSFLAKTQRCQRKQCKYQG